MIMSSCNIPFMMNLFILPILMYTSFKRMACVTYGISQCFCLKILVLFYFPTSIRLIGMVPKVRVGCRLCPVDKFNLVKCSLVLQPVIKLYICIHGYT